MDQGAPAFVRGIAQPEKAQPGKHDWAVFLTTDTTLRRIAYWNYMRLKYFKEAKQYLASSRNKAITMPPYRPLDRDTVLMWGEGGGHGERHVVDYPPDCGKSSAVIAGAMDEMKMLIGDRPLRSGNN